MLILRIKRWRADIGRQEEFGGSESFNMKGNDFPLNISPSTNLIFFFIANHLLICSFVDYWSTFTDLISLWINEIFLILIVNCHMTNCFFRVNAGPVFTDFSLLLNILFWDVEPNNL